MKRTRRSSAALSASLIISTTLRDVERSRRVRVIACFVFALAFAPLVASSAAAHGPRRLYPTVEGAEARRGQLSPRSTGPDPSLTYHGGVHGIGVTTGAPQVYVVFWGAQWGIATPPGSTHLSNDPVGVAPRVEALLAGIGTNDEHWSGVMTQYCEGVPGGTITCPASAPHVPYPTGGVLAGIWNDTAISAPAAATYSELAGEALAAAAHFGNTTPASNRNAQYVIVSPKGTHPDGFQLGGGFCAWHSYVSTSYGDIAFTNLPYLPDAGSSCGANFVNAGSGGLLDGVSIVEGHEYAETITDQNPSGGWLDLQGEENADKCAWVKTGTGAAQNVPFATGTFAMQSTWSNDGSACLIAHEIWGVPGLPDDFVVNLAPRTGFTSPGGNVETQLLTTTITGNPQGVDLSATGVPPDTTVSFAPTTMSSDDTSSVTITTSDTTPFGTYPIALTATGALTRSATFVLSVGGPPAPLTEGVAVTGISGAADSAQYWYLDEPASQDIVDISLAGGTGDADLYVRRNAPPSPDVYDCRSASGSNLETCLQYINSGGRFYVLVYGAQPFADVTLTNARAFPIPVISGNPERGLDGHAGTRVYFWLMVPAGMRRLTVTVSGAHGDVDLYVRRGGLPSPAANLCASERRGRRGERCRILNPVGGTYHMMIQGYTDFSRATFRATYR